MKNKRLYSQVLPVSELTSEFIEVLFSLFSRFYENVTLERFRQDLEEKDYVILLRDQALDLIRGFSTQKLLHFTVDKQPLQALFSGDTVIDPEFWGEQELVRGWCKVAGHALVDHPKRRLFWFLISKGFRTYLYLPVFYHEFYPRFDRPTPPFEQQIIDTLAQTRYLPYYEADSGLLKFNQSLGNLTPDLAVIPLGRENDPHVRFFLERNPQYAEGTELVCLAEISLENTKAMGRRWIQQAIRDQFAHRSLVEVASHV